MKLILIFIIAFNLLFTSSAYSHETVNLSSESKHMKIPNYCIVQPSDSQLDENQKDRLIKMAQYAVEEWNSNFQENFNYSYKWQLMSTVISGADHASNFKCDWVLSFQNRMPSFTHDFVLGYTDNVYQEIRIMFSEINEDKLHDVLLHEIGHSMGLGHFTAEEYNIISKQKPSEYFPSIMVANIHTNPGPNYITQVDIDKIKSVYGTGGLVREHEKETENIQLESPALDILENVSVSSEKLVAKKYQSNTMTISGNLSKNFILSGVPLYIITTNPDLSTSVSKIQPTGTGKFHVPLTFDQDFMKGEYSIEMVYRDRVITHHSVKYWVEDEFSADPVQKAVNESKIPGWIKNNARWWSSGFIDDNSFVNLIQYLIKEGMINIPNLPEQVSDTAEYDVPGWIKNNARWWSDGLISEDDFVQGIKFLVQTGIVVV